jgi:hypothetical protein
MEIAAETPNIRGRKHSSRSRTALILICGVLPLIILQATPAYAAAGDITTVIDSIRNWVAGILAALATLFLTVGGVRYLIANGNPRAMEEGKAAIKSALIGYALAALAPMFVDILRRVLAA